jgi:hypothetical protein
MVVFFHEILYFLCVCDTHEINFMRVPLTKYQILTKSIL